MANNLVTTKEFEGKRVVSASKGKRIGKVRAFVFHPTKKRVLGFTVKRPDAALMFKRSDLFVALGSYSIDDEGKIVVENDAAKTGKEVCKTLGVDYDTCVLWVGMPAMTESGEMLGCIDNVTFDEQTGAVDSFTTERGATADALLGKHIVPANCIRGFRIGQGDALSQVGDCHGEEEGDDVLKGCVLVSDDVDEFSTSGGAAEAAGKASAVAMHKAKQGVERAKATAEVAVDKAKTQASEAAEKAKPVAQAAAKKTGEAVNKGAYAAGKQLGRATGMFSAFKEEFNKALKDEDDKR